MPTRERKSQARQVAGRVISTAEIRKNIEDAKDFVDAIGDFTMEFNGEEYTIQLSRHVKGKVAYDTQDGEVVIILPDRSMWRRCRDGHWDGHTLNIHIDQMEEIHEHRQKMEWAKSMIRRADELAALSPDARQYEIMQDNVTLSRRLHDVNNKIQEME